MGGVVVKQPNGLLAVFSAVVNDFIVTDATEDELADELSQITGKKALDAMIRDGIEDRPVPPWILFTVARSMTTGSIAIDIALR